MINIQKLVEGLNKKIEKLYERRGEDCAYCAWKITLELKEAGSDKKIVTQEHNGMYADGSKIEL